jgi:hypothetical protein
MTRERLPNRRSNETFEFTHEGHQYRATTSRFADGRLAEVFLDVGKVGSAAQENGDIAAILASLALQHGVPEILVRHAVLGPIRAALDRATA